MIRWTAKRKAEILERIRSGVQTFETVRDGYLISAEELASWERNHAAKGTMGLRATVKQNRGAKNV